jgi:hypothetical protein
MARAPFLVHHEQDTVKDMSQNEMPKLTLGEIKRAHKQAKRQNAKAKRKLDTIQKLREETEKLRKDTRQVEGDISTVSSLMWSPPPRYDY